MNSQLIKEEKTFWVWAKQAGGYGWTYGSDIAVDEKGNIYVVGFLSGTSDYLGTSSGTSDFDGQILTCRGEMDMLIVKYRPNGSLDWIKQFGDKGFSNAASVAIGKEGNLYITGTIGHSILEYKPGTVEHLPGYARLDSFELRSGGADDEDMFIACLSTLGEPLWAVQPGSLGEVRGEGIAVDGAGNCYVTGTFKGSFGDTDLISTGKEDIFVAKYNHRGQLQWVRGAGGPGKDDSKDIAVDQDGNCYVTGSFEKEAMFADVKPSSNFDVNFFLSKYDKNGKLVWVRYASGNLKDSYCFGVAVDAERNSYITGGFTGELVLGSTRLNSTPTDDLEAPESERYDDVFVVKYDPDGKLVWAVQGGGSKGDFGRDITVDGTGNVYITGSFYGNAAFGSIKLAGSPPDFTDRLVFIAKFDQNGTLRWAEQSTRIHTGFSWAQSSGNGIAINSQGDCYVTGFFDNALQFGSIKLEGLNSRNMFVAKINPR